MNTSLLHRLFFEREKLSTSQVGLLLAAVLLVKNVMGFLSQMVLAKEFGAHALSDSYFLALNLPQIFGDFLLGGILLFSIVPLSLQIREKNGPENQKKVHFTFLVLVVAVSGVLAVFYALLAPQIIPLLAPGFSKEVQSQAICMARVLSPVLACWAVSGFLAGLFTVYRQFISAVLVSMVPSLTLIFFCQVMRQGLGDVRLVGGTLAGALLQNALALWMLGKSKPFTACWIASSFYRNEFKKLVGLGLPMTLPVLFNGLFSLEQKILASQGFQGAVSWLNYANILYLTAGLLVLNAFQTLVYPKFSDLAAKKELEKNKDLFFSSIRFVLFTGIPITLFFILLRKPLVSLFFERGFFIQQDCFETASILAWMLLGFSAHSCVQISMRLSFAEYQPWDYVKASLGGTLAGVLAAPVLFKVMGIRGLGLAYALISIVTWQLMMIRHAKTEPQFHFSKWLPFLLQLIVLCLVPAAVLFLINQMLESQWDAYSLIQKFLYLSGLFVSGIGLYLGLGRVFRLREAAMLVQLLNIKRWRE